MTAPTEMQAAARERLLRDAERVRREGHGRIADGMVAGATDNLPEFMATGIATAPGLAVYEVTRAPGWVVAVLDHDGSAVAAWSYLPDCAGVAQ